MPFESHGFVFIGVGCKKCRRFHVLEIREIKVKETEEDNLFHRN